MYNCAPLTYTSRVKVDGFDWDSGNLFKNEAKHGISRETVEAFFGRNVWVAPDPKHSSTEDRFLAIGRSPGEKPMIVAFTVRAARGLKLIRPISARFMHAKEIARYDQAFTQDEE
jgi:uncharacterized DUF497 family protein